MAAICKSYLLPCPYAISIEDAPVPCMGSQENCDAYRLKYEKEAPEIYNKLKEMKKDLGSRVNFMSQESLIEMINKEFS